MGLVKTTIEIPDELFKKAKATAALQGESLRELICDALETRLASAPAPQTDRSGWRSVFGLADAKEVAKVDKFIDADLERVDPSQWR
jgi:hypothetical protein